jgi:hypothetical protein
MQAAIVGAKMAETVLSCEQSLVSLNFEGTPISSYKVFQY